MGKLDFSFSVRVTSQKYQYRDHVLKHLNDKNCRLTDLFFNRMSFPFSPKASISEDSVP